MKRWGLFEVCSCCDEPTNIFCVSSYLGFNPGVDGHLFKSGREADEALRTLMDLIRDESKPRGERANFKFPDLGSELSYLGNRIRILPVNFPTIK